MNLLNAILADFASIPSRVDTIANDTQRRVALLAEMDAAYRDMLDTAGKPETELFDAAATRFRAAREAVDAHKLSMGESL